MKEKNSFALGESVQDQASSVDPGSKKSMRTTFRISKNAIDTMSSISKKYEITMKELFDDLLEDEQITEGMAKAIANSKVDANKLKPDEYKRKTYVISRRSLQKLRTLTGKHKISRDRLVEVAIIVYKELLDYQMEKNRKSYEKALKELSGFKKEAYKVMDKLENIGEDHDYVYDFDMICEDIGHLEDNIKSYLEKIIPIDN